MIKYYTAMYSLLKKHISLYIMLVRHQILMNAVINLGETLEYISKASGNRYCTQGLQKDRTYQIT